MGLKKEHWFLIGFTLLYILAFTTYYVSIGNYEFLGYVFVLAFFFLLVLFTLEKNKFDSFILWGLSIWGFLHMSGGGIRIKGDVLYNLHLIDLINSGEIYILKYDQFVHCFGFFIATLVVWHLLKPYLNKDSSHKVIYPLVVLGGMGLGALNEIIEFVATIIIPGTNVGGYVNNALDLVFNTIGAIIAVILIHFRRKN